MSKHLIALVLLTLIPAAQAGELGRLFNTPQQRQQLEYQGSGSNTPSNEDGSGAVSSNRKYIIVNGVVQKQGGKRTIWVNGTAQTTPTGNDKTPASVPVTVPGKSNPVQLKVGQRLMLDAPAADEDK